MKEVRGETVFDHFTMLKDKYDIEREGGLLLQELNPLFLSSFKLLVYLHSYLTCQRIILSSFLFVPIFHLTRDLY